MSKKFRKDIDKVTVNKETQAERKILKDDGKEKRGPGGVRDGDEFCFFLT